MSRYLDLPTRDTNGALRAVVETPKGSQVKIALDAKTKVFVLERRLVLGIAYPYDWGFIPSTLAPDGDPLDVMIVHEEPTYPGVVIPCVEIGVVRVSQSKGERNDRIIASPIEEPHDLDKRMRKEIETFFESAVLHRKKIVIEGWGNAKEARRLIKKAQRAWDKENG